jgi:hypothetical protein
MPPWVQGFNPASVPGASEASTVCVRCGVVVSRRRFWAHLENGCK